MSLNQHDLKNWADQAYVTLRIIDIAFDQLTASAPTTLKPLLLQFEQAQAVMEENDE